MDKERGNLSEKHYTISEQAIDFEILKARPKIMKVLKCGYGEVVLKVSGGKIVNVTTLNSFNV